ncbi:TPA: glycosyltransferase family 4 protein, partial [Escherichia coli]|nr:glycosyltransferase family 4 protein [Escherichia coli]
KVLIVSNMYPSIENPSLGVFVKNTEEMLVNANIDVDRAVIDRIYSNSFEKVFGYFIFYLKVIYKILFCKCDIVYAHYVSHVAIPIFFVNLFKHIVVFSHVHGGDVKQLKGTSAVFFKIKQALSKKIMDISKVIFSPSASYKRHIIELYSQDESKIIIFPSGGIDTTLFSFGSGRKKNILGYAGRLEDSKNVDLIIKSLIDNKYNLEIVGDGKKKGQLQELVSKYNLSERVIFHSSKTQKELSEWYKRVSILIYPSSSESLGLVPLEALACGTDVLLSPIDAFFEFRDIGLQFEFLSELTPQAINVGIEKIISTRCFRNNMSNNIIINSVYARNVVCKEFIDVFKQKCHCF